MWTMILGAALAQQPVAVEFRGPDVTVGVLERVASSTTATAQVTRQLCRAPCTLELEPGEYRFYAEAPGTFVAPKPFSVEGPMVLEARRSTVRDAGLGLIASGLAVAAIGGVGSGLNRVDNGAETALTGAFFTGLGAAAIGVPLTISGRGSWRARATPAVP